MYCVQQQISTGRTKRRSTSEEKQPKGLHHGIAVKGFFVRNRTPSVSKMATFSDQWVN
jgi:hypothetical protein